MNNINKNSMDILKRRGRKYFKGPLSGVEPKTKAGRANYRKEERIVQYLRKYGLTFGQLIDKILDKKCKLSSGDRDLAIYLSTTKAVRKNKKV